VHETYRMLGRERELDFEREASRRALAAGAARPQDANAETTPRRRRGFYLLHRPLRARPAE